MKTKVLAATTLLALGATAQAQLSGPNRTGIGSIGSSPGTFQTPSSGVGSTGTGQSLNSDTLMRPGQTTTTQGTFGSQDRLNPTLPSTTSPLPDTTRPTLPDTTSPLSDTTTGSQTENPAGVFRDAPAPSSGVTPQTGVGSADATRGSVDPFATPTLRRSDDLNGIGGPASGEVGNDRRRLTPPPDFRPTPRPLGDTSSTPSDRTFEKASAVSAQTVNPDTSNLDKSSLSGGPQAPKVGSDLTTTGVNTPPRTQQQPLDQALTAKIRAQLSQPVSTKSAARVNAETIRDLRITSQNGRVILEGMVNTPQERDLIELRAREVQGVANVDNRLKVRERNVGAPAARESGRGQDRTSGESKQNSSDLDDSHPDVTPDR